MMDLRGLTCCSEPASIPRRTRTDVARLVGRRGLALRVSLCAEFLHALLTMRRMSVLSAMIDGGGARVSALLLAAGLWLAGGCGAPYAYEPSPPRASAARGETIEGHGALAAFYATDRAPSGIDTPLLYFGGDRSNKLRTGLALVSIPDGHGIGRMEEPLLAPDPRHHLVVTELRRFDHRGECIAAINERLAASPRREVLVVVHGYASIFYDAARRAAQIGHDIGFEGPVVCYSWPAQGGLLSYLVDEVNGEWTLPHLEEFLYSLRTETQAERICVLAHSMGCRITTRAIKELVRDHPDLAARGPVLDELILAAGDMDAELFERDYARFVRRAARRTTIYVSAADRALDGSRWLHKYARLGQADVDARSALAGDAASVPVMGSDWRMGAVASAAQTAEPTARKTGGAEADGVETGIDIVDVTAVDRTWLGHAYYGSSPQVLRDVRGVIDGAAVAERGLERGDGAYRMMAVK